MVKIIGIVIVLATTTLLGFSKVNDNIKRVKYLKCMESCVVRLENEIRYTKSPIKDVFLQCSKCDDHIISTIFEHAYKLLDENSGKTIGYVWDESVKMSSKNIYKDDMDLLSSFGEYLSSADVEGYSKSLNLFSHNLSEMVLEAEYNYNTNKKLYKWLGIYSGATIAVLFL